MSDTAILLSNNINDEEKIKAATNIIKIYELPLNEKQITLAFGKVLDWINDYREPGKGVHKNTRLFLFNELLNINKAMFVALILALCDNFNPGDMYHYIRLVKYSMQVGLSDVVTRIKSYFILLDYYEFDVNNIQYICEEGKQKIQAYRIEKYTGKMTKQAIKNK